MGDLLAAAGCAGEFGQDPVVARFVLFQRPLSAVDHPWPAQFNHVIHACAGKREQHRGDLYAHGGQLDRRGGRFPAHRRLDLGRRPRRNAHRDIRRRRFFGRRPNQSRPFPGWHVGRIHGLVVHRFVVRFGRRFWRVDRFRRPGTLLRFVRRRRDAGRRLVGRRGVLGASVLGASVLVGSVLLRCRLLLCCRLLPRDGLTFTQPRPAEQAEPDAQQRADAGRQNQRPVGRWLRPFRAVHCRLPELLGRLRWRTQFDAHVGQRRRARGTTGGAAGGSMSSA